MVFGSQEKEAVCSHYLSGDKKIEECLHIKKVYFCSVDSADSAAGGQFILYGLVVRIFYTSLKFSPSLIHTSVTLFPSCTFPFIRALT